MVRCALPKTEDRSAYQAVACPLCSCDDTHTFGSIRDPDRERRYHRCRTCALTFLDPHDRLDAAAERAHYDTHENDVADLGYRKFLSRLADPLLARIEPQSNVLDYGCGPGPALVALLNENGHRAFGFDPIYAPNTDLLSRRYDAITCTETAEHFFNPATELARLFELLRSRGWLAIMTSELTDDDRFARWHYRADPTHVCFYRAETFDWIARRFDAELVRPRQNVALFQTP